MTEFLESEIVDSACRLPVVPYREYLLSSALGCDAEAAVRRSGAIAAAVDCCGAGGGDDAIAGRGEGPLWTGQLYPQPLES